MPKRPPVFGQEQRKAAAKLQQRDRNKRPQKAIYNSAAWKLQRARVFLRDGYQCVDCGRLVGIVPGDAHCDHIEPLTGAYHVEDSALVTRCQSCHMSKTAREDGGYGNRPAVSK